MLILGTDKTDTILEHLPESFLLIDDGPVIDALTLPVRRKVTQLDLSVHSFNPLARMDYLKARQFVAMLNSVFPEGESTLTRKNSNFILLKALVETNARTLDTLLSPSKDPAGQDAYQKIETLLLSPVLRRFLTSPTKRLSLTGILIARLDRAALGDFDCFVIGNLLIASYPGQAVIPDFPFYAIQSHSQLIRQDRMIAGANFLDELPVKLRQQLLLGAKIGCRTTADDAEVLAGYGRFRKGTEGYSALVEAYMTKSDSASKG